MHGTVSILLMVLCQKCNLGENEYNFRILEKEREAKIIGAAGYSQ